MKRRISVFLLAISLFAVSAPSFAVDKTPIQLALFNPIQIFNDETSIAGLRLSLLYGRNADVTGLDWGLVTGTTGDLTGIQWGFVGIVNGDVTGIQATNFNIAKSDMSGIQWGWYNYTMGHASGLQVALINRAGTMKGIQLGLLNFIKQDGWFPFFPIINGKL